MWSCDPCVVNKEQEKDLIIGRPVNVKVIGLVWCKVMTNEKQDLKNNPELNRTPLKNLQ